MLTTKEKAQRYDAHIEQLTEGLATLIGNESKTYDHWFARAEAHRKNAPSAEEVQSGTWSVEQAERFTLADELKEHFELEIERFFDYDGFKLKMRDASASFLVREELEKHFKEVVFMQALASDSFGLIDWHDLADTLLSWVSDAKRYEQE